MKWKGISGIPRGAVWCKRVDLVTASLGEGRLTDIFSHPAFIEIVASSSNQAMLHMRTSTLPLAGAGDAPLRPACMGGKETPVWFCVSLRSCTTATCSASGGYSCTAAPAHSFDWAFEGASHIEACTRSMSTDIVTQQDRRGVVYRFGEATTRTYGLDGMVPTSSS